MPQNLAVLRTWKRSITIVDSISIPVQVGGGIRNMQAAEHYFAIGVERVIVGTAAVSDRGFLEELCEKFPNRGMFIF